MRKPRLTWPGALHLVINRGIKGEKIFKGKELKEIYTQLLREKSDQLKVKLYAFVVKDDQYQVVLENSSGRMSDLFRALNAQYASEYRAQYPGKGVVFQERFKSWVIQKKYLKQTIASLNKKATPLPVVFTPHGPYIGDPCYKEEVLKKANPIIDTDDSLFTPPEEILEKFEAEFGVSPDELDIYTLKGKRLRGELLVRLKDESGLKYSEILEFPIFSDLKIGSMGSMYFRTKKRLSAKNKV